MEGYQAGQSPPELRPDGSFKTPLGFRAFSIVDNESGTILVVNDEVLVEDKEGDEP